jgi:hypothetical protein
MAMGGGAEMIDKKGIVWFLFAAGLIILYAAAFPRSFKENGWASQFEVKSK